MKLATLKDNSRDGKLVVVNKNLTMAVLVPEIAITLQQALDQWAICEAELQICYEQLNSNKLSHAFPFHTEQVTAPLPRAFQWADGSAYVNHVELVRKARGAELPENFWHDPLIYQGGSDSFLGAHDAIPLYNEAWGLDFEAEIGIITNDVPIGVKTNQASQHICLFVLINDISLRNLIPNELAKGFGFFQSKPSTAFGPVAVTPDEFGLAWDDKRIHLPVLSYYNQQLFGQPNAGIDMTFDFPTLLCHAAKTRMLTAGTIIGSGTISNRDHSKGSSCIAEKRMLEILEHGQAITPFMKKGDQIKIEVLDNNKQTIFGAISQSVTAIEESKVYA